MKNEPTTAALAIRATIAQTPATDRFAWLNDHVVTVDDSGTIVAVEPFSSATAPADLIELGSDRILIPGMIDTHLHAPQWPQLGTGLDLPLDEWLMERTFPLEARFGQEEFARSVWAEMVPRLLAFGTTTALYYSSIHEPATLALAEQCMESGQRALIGRVAMDLPDGTPDFYRDPSPSEAVAASARSLEAIAALDTSLVAGVITPRFIPACTDAALEGLAELAEATGARIQTHCSEGDWEHQYVIDRCGMHDAFALDRFGLLQDHTVLAHATHINGDDRALIVERGAGVAHCPLSNAYFANAVFAARSALDAGMRVGLGTDVAGGPSASLLGQCAHAVTASRLLEDGVDPLGAAQRRPARIDVVAAFHMATAGGAELLGLPVGLLEPGRQFDAVAIDLTAAGVGELDRPEPARVFEKIVRLADSAAIERVWVDGRLVIGDR